MKAIILFLFAMTLTVIFSCEKSEPGTASQQQPIADSIPQGIVTDSVESGISTDIALMQWENCMTRSCIQKPSMFSILSYIRSNTCRPEILTILIERFLSENKNGILSISRSDMYRIASGAAFDISTPSDAAPGKSYFTDSSAVLIIKTDVCEDGFYLESMWRYPLQDWCSLFSGSTPSLSIDRTTNTFAATYNTPVPVTFFSDTTTVSAHIRTIRWTALTAETQRVFTINQPFVYPATLRGVLITTTPVATDSVTVSWQSWCAWSIDIDNDSIADLRTIASGDTLTDKGKFDLFAQVNIDGQWITTDYKIGCETQMWDDYNITKHNYIHREWNVWDEYSVGSATHQMQQVESQE